MEENLLHQQLSVKIVFAQPPLVRYRKRQGATEVWHENNPLGETAGTLAHLAPPLLSDKVAARSAFLFFFSFIFFNTFEDPLLIVA